ncbi:hypothetical protein SHO565_59280 [Streptomyces sp. HO565]
MSRFREPEGNRGDENRARGVRVNHIALPATAAPTLGENARIRLIVTGWD